MACDIKCIKFCFFRNIIIVFEQLFMDKSLILYKEFQYDILEFC